MTLAPDDPRHGTVNGYVNRKCRCAACRAANTESTRILRARRVERTRANGGIAPVAQHGTLSTRSNWLCGCVDCLAVDAAAHKRAHYRRRQSINSTNDTTEGAP